MNEKEKECEFASNKQKTKGERKTASNDNEQNCLLNLDLLALDLVLNQTSLADVLAFGRSCKHGTERVKLYLRQLGSVDRVSMDVKLFRKFEDQRLELSDFQYLDGYLIDVLDEACQNGHLLSLNAILSQLPSDIEFGWRQVHRLVRTAYLNGHPDCVPLLVDSFRITKQLFLDPAPSRSCLDAACESGNFAAVQWCCEKFCIERADVLGLLESIIFHICRSNNVQVATYLTKRFCLVPEDQPEPDMNQSLSDGFLPNHNLALVAWYIETFSPQKQTIIRCLTDYAIIPFVRSLELFSSILRQFEITEEDLRRRNDAAIGRILEHAFLGSSFAVLDWLRKEWTIHWPDVVAIFGPPLQLACKCGSLEMIAYLLDWWPPRQYWGDVRFVYIEALAAAVHCDRLEIVKRLIQKANLFNGPDAENDKMLLETYLKTDTNNLMTMHETLDYLIIEYGIKK